MKAAAYMIGAVLMLLLGEAAPRPEGVPYFVLCVVLASLGLREIWLSRRRS